MDKSRSSFFSLIGWMWTFIILSVIILTLVEIWLLCISVARIGFWQTVLWIIISAVGGLQLMHWEGRRYWGRVLAFKASDLNDQDKVARQYNIMRDGVLIIIGGVFLVLPGLITDVLGLLLFIPPFRILVRILFLRNVTFISPYIPQFHFSNASGFSCNTGNAGFTGNTWDVNATSVSDADSEDDPAESGSDVFDGYKGPVAQVDDFDSGERFSDDGSIHIIDVSATKPSDTTSPADK